MTTKRIFITHASVDQPLAKALCDLLKMGADLTDDEIFCSSVDGLGVPTGENFIAHIQQQLQGVELALLLVTPAYLHSTFCMWELGGLWVRDVDWVPLVTMGVRREELDGPLSKIASHELDRDGLNDLLDAVRMKLNASSRSTAWEDARDAFLDEIGGGLLDKLRSRYVSQEATKSFRAVAYGQVAPLLHDTLHQLRDAAFIRVLYDEADAVQPTVQAQFRNELTATVNQMAALFTAMTGVKCRVCIKQAEMPQAAEGSDQDHDRIWYVADLCRSGGTPVERERFDRALDNTDFDQILSHTVRYFIGNDLPAMHAAGEYRNSHWEDGPPDDPSYRASMVWPIWKLITNLTAIPELSDRLSAQQRTIDKSHHLLGFLCVDAKETNVFHDEFEGLLGAALADALYYVLAPWIPALPLNPRDGGSDDSGASESVPSEDGE